MWVLNGDLNLISPYSPHGLVLARPWINLVVIAFANKCLVYLSPVSNETFKLFLRIIDKNSMNDSVICLPTP